MSPEGSGEIEAARRRLKAANAQAMSASQNMKQAKTLMANAESMMAAAIAAKEAADAMKTTAESNMYNASTQVDTAAKEVKEAEAFLKQAEKRWMVIDVDAPHEGLQADDARSQKKRKILLSPSDNTNGNSTSHAAPVIDEGQNAPHRESTMSSSPPSATGSSDDGNGRDGDAVSRTNQFVFTSTDVMEPLSYVLDMHVRCRRKKVSVTGTCLAEVDGMYKKNGSHEGAALYEKDGCWNLRKGRFIIIQGKLTGLSVSMNSLIGRACLLDEIQKYWFIGFYDGNPGNHITVLFRSSMGPFAGERNWIPTRALQQQRGSSSILTREVVGERSKTGRLLCDRVAIVNGRTIEQISVNSCGIPEANGKYDRDQGHHDGVSVYMKMGHWGGKNDKFWIFRRKSEGGLKVWHLVFSGRRDNSYGIRGSNYLYSAECFSSGPMYNVPPKTGWNLTKSGKGVAPSPQLNWE